MKRAKKNSKKRYSLFLLIIAIGIGFATLTATLNINGTVLFKGKKFDVHFDDAHAVYNEDAVTTLSIDGDDSTEVTFAGELYIPGDYYIFTVDAVNDGDYDAMVDVINSISLTEEQEEYMDIDITYASGKAISRYHELKKGTKVTYLVKVTYKDVDEVDNLKSADSDDEFTFGVKYIKADENATSDYKTTTQLTSLTNEKYSFLIDETISDYDSAITKVKRAYWIDSKYLNDSNYLLYDGDELNGENNLYYFADGDTFYFYTEADELVVNTSFNYILTCCNHKVEEFDLSDFDSVLFNTLENMFNGFEKLPTIDLSNCKYSNSISASSMFYNCKALRTINWGDVDSIVLTNTSSMFYYCSLLSNLDITMLRTSSVQNMSNMFFRCSSLTSLDFSNFDTSSAQTINSMFNFCTGLKSLDLRTFDTTNVTNTRLMFANCTSLTTIIVSEKFVLDGVTEANSTSMFNKCTSLVGENNTTYDSTKTKKSMAVVDGYYYDDVNQQWVFDDTRAGYFTHSV